MSWINAVKINIIVTLGLLIAIEITLIIAFSVRDAYLINEDLNGILAPNVTRETIGFREEARNFRGYPYKAFLGWTSPNIKGVFLNVKDGRRKTIISQDLIGEKKLHFFGGSTMWGHSVSDKNTIPSLISHILNLETINYAEQAYNSRQELNLLIDNLEKIKKGDIVIFYDGVNDVYHNCRSYNSPNGHAREFYIRTALNYEKNHQNIDFGFVKKLSTYRFLKGLTVKFFPGNEMQEKGYINSCADPVYAKDVASFLVKNWKAAQALLKSRGVDYMCILQPNPYTFDGSLAYANEEMKSQIAKLYPIIKNKGRDLSCFKDYSSVLTEDNYVDSCCHLNEVGNAELSTRMSADIYRKIGESSLIKR